MFFIVSSAIFLTYTHHHQQQRSITSITATHKMTSFIDHTYLYNKLHS